MLEQSRGRPRKKSRIPSKLSHKLPISASQPVSHQASQATHFSLSDEAPTPVDEISHGATFDDVDVSTSRIHHLFYHN